MSDGYVLLIVWLCLVTAVWMVAHPMDCDDSACQQVHNHHRIEQRRREAVLRHTSHYQRDPFCERCERGEPPRDDPWMPRP